LGALPFPASLMGRPKRMARALFFSSSDVMPGDEWFRRFGCRCDEDSIGVAGGLHVSRACVCGAGGGVV
jgi:hypothetical protein